MLHIHLHPIDLFVRADSLNTEQQVVKLPVKLPLVHHALVEVSLIVVKTRIVVLLLIYVLHGVVHIFFLLVNFSVAQIGGITHII